MKASEFIKDMQDFINEHGDLEVILSDDSVALIEFNDDDDPVFIIA